MTLAWARECLLDLHDHHVPKLQAKTVKGDCKCLINTLLYAIKTHRVPKCTKKLGKTKQSAKLLEINYESLIKEANP